ncbi:MULTISPECIES: hypothetical protein [unclassified Erysipelothrix]|uniref:hypothetical protein n=1 Tax=unclassified Erysipelothrix TaxID=2624170 RepID=UPI001378D0EE|nr:MULTISPECIES: hypothetical protein [unclassified Erysipelothrix]MBK2402867.1 hypothetical protein [Erysipelothrix sp. strain 2 (EsS2-6-Brazil)]MBK2404336.1 hypothetical protein [Erysipelothrix sp. strain 2 (EsS2-7-Brazil)]NBA01642.1 hypothetical protein [Erysipelothrix rhusiopathiae]
MSAVLDLFANMKNQVLKNTFANVYQVSTIALEWAMMIKHSSKLSSVSLRDLLRFSTTRTTFEIMYATTWDQNRRNP